MSRNGTRDFAPGLIPCCISEVWIVFYSRAKDEVIYTTRSQVDCKSTWFCNQLGCLYRPFGANSDGAAFFLICTSLIWQQSWVYHIATVSQSRGIYEIHYSMMWQLRLIFRNGASFPSQFPRRASEPKMSFTHNSGNHWFCTVIFWITRIWPLL